MRVGRLQASSFTLSLPATLLWLCAASRVWLQTRSCINSPLNQWDAIPLLPVLSSWVLSLQLLICCTWNGFAL